MVCLTPVVPTASRKQKRSSGVAKREKRARAAQAPSLPEARPELPAEAPRETLLAGHGVSDLDDVDDALAAMNRAATDQPRRTALVRRRA